MSAFANLMALSATQTREQESAVEMALRERQRKEALRRKQQAEQEAKDREMERQRRLKLFEDQKREEERKKREAEQKVAKERAAARREQEQREKLLYGPKKAARMASSSAGSSRTGDGQRSGVRRRGSDDSDNDSGPVPLTREEKRARKAQMEMKRMSMGAKRSTPAMSGGYQKSGRKLPGGAVDLTIDHANASPAGSDGKSVKDRLAAMPNALIKLNAVKRDTRTIEEIVQDVAKKNEGKVLEGAKALGFDDWFSDRKKQAKEPEKKSTPTPGPASQSRLSSVGPTSGTNTPLSSQATPNIKRPSTSLKPAPVSRPPPAPIARASTSTASSRPSTSSRPATVDRAADRAKTAQTKPSKPPQPERQPSSKRASTFEPKKRAQSDSRSESPPPKRRRRTPDYDEDDDDVPDFRQEIWQLFGRKRDQYVNQDVFSDDDDMEVDARALEREEKRSARLAAQEDQRALEEERKREEEKRRRKRELQRAGRG